MIQFDLPLVWLLLPLPLLVYRWLPPFNGSRMRLRVPFTVSFVGRIEQSSRPVTAGLPLPSLVGRWLIWTLLLVAAARPIILEPPLTHLEPKRALVLAIDLSESMAEKDVSYLGEPPIERLSAVKEAAGDFITKRGTDRIGLIGFGDKAFPLAPPTSQHRTLTTILKNLESGMAGANTALGDAVGVTLKLLEASDMPEKVLILLTDGNDNRSLLDPLQAARIAADSNLTIHTVGFGQHGSDTDEAVDVETLQKIATLTGGQAFMASNPESLDRVYSNIDEITPRNAETLKAQPRNELFWVPVLGASGVLLIMLLTSAAHSQFSPLKEKQNREEPG